MKSCPNCRAIYPDNFAICPQDATPLIEAEGWSEGSVVRGKYRILNKVGQGGMGAVYKALHLKFDVERFCLATSVIDGTIRKLYDG